MSTISKAKSEEKQAVEVVETYTCFWHEAAGSYFISRDSKPPFPGCIPLFLLTGVKTNDPVCIQSEHQPTVGDVVATIHLHRIVVKTVDWL